MIYSDRCICFFPEILVFEMILAVRFQVESRLAKRLAALTSMLYGNCKRVFYVVLLRSNAGLGRI